MSMTFWLVICAGLAILLTQYGLRHWLPQPYDFSRLRKLQTSDGWPLALYQFPAKLSAESPDSRGTIVLCADLGEAPLLWSWGASGGWVATLQNAGYDVWIACLRGTDQSEPRYLDARLGWGWTAETHMERDLPALLDVIQAESQGPLHWVGRGFGGVLPLLVPEEARRLASVAVVGAGPGSRGHVIDRLLRRLVSWWPWPVFPVRQLYLTVLPFHLAYGWGHRLLKRHEASASEETLAFFHQCIHGLRQTSAPLLAQWLHSLEVGEWQPPTDGDIRDQEGDLLALVGRSSCETLFLGDWEKRLPKSLDATHRPLPALSGAASTMLAPLSHQPTRALVSQEYLDWLGTHT